MLQALQMLAPTHITLNIFGNIGGLPHFNPDLDGHSPPWEVLKLRQAVTASQGIVVSTPEYAGGIPGSLKNAFDWLLGSGELRSKPVMIVQLSITARYVRRALLETLASMGANVPPEAMIELDFAGKAVNAEHLLSDVKLARSVRKAFECLEDAVESRDRN